MQSFHCYKKSVITFRLLFVVMLVGKFPFPNNYN